MIKAVRIITCFLLMLFTSTCSTHEGKERTVYVTRTGKKYHEKGCRYLSATSTMITLQEAICRNYTPCSICCPVNENINAGKESFLPSTDTSTSYSEPRAGEQIKTTQLKSTATQCTAITRAGTRCKRRTRNPSGKCYQHDK